MPNRDAQSILAENLKGWIADSKLYNTPGAVARKAGLAVNTVKNMLNRNGYPTLDKVEKVAQVFGFDAWELIHPDPARARREREMYARIAQDFIDRAKAASRQS